MHDRTYRDGKSKKNSNHRATKCSVKCRRKLKIVLEKIFFSYSGMLTIVCCYVVFGALLFKCLDNYRDNADSVEKKKNIFEKHTERCLREMWNITERMHVLYQKNWTNLISEPIRKLEMDILDEIIRGSRAKEVQDFLRSKQKWSLTGYILYCITIITTIGNNGLYINTADGKLATILYAIIGIPLIFFCILNTGCLMTDLLCYVNYNIGQIFNNNNNKEYYGNPTGRCTCRYDENALSQKTIMAPQSSSSSVTTGLRSGESDIKKSTTAGILIQKKDVIVCLDNKRPTENIILHRLEDCPTCQSTFRLPAQLSSADNQLSPKRIRTTNNRFENANNCIVCYRNNNASKKNSNTSSVKITTNTNREQQPSAAVAVAQVKNYKRRYDFLFNDRIRRPNVSTIFLLVILAGYVCLAAVAFSLWKKKSFFDGIQFCFRTVLTINLNGTFLENPVSPTVYELIVHSLHFWFSLTLIFSLIFAANKKLFRRCKPKTIVVTRNNNNNNNNSNNNNSNNNNSNNNRR